MSNTNNTTISEKILDEGIILCETAKLIEMLAEVEIKENILFSPAAITMAFTQTHCKPFSRTDVDFIKACKQSEELNSLWTAVQTLAKIQEIECAKGVLHIRNRLRAEIKSEFLGLVFYR